MHRVFGSSEVCVAVFAVGVLAQPFPRFLHGGEAAFFCFSDKLQFRLFAVLGGAYRGDGSVVFAAGGFNQSKVYLFHFAFPVLFVAMGVFKHIVYLIANKMFSILFKFV